MAVVNPLFLSVDWDFFVEYNSNDYDFQHSESPLYSGLLWNVRFQNGFFVDEDITKTITLSKKPPQAITFWETLGHLGYRLSRDKTEMSVDDSHASAASFFLTKAIKREIDVVHFDAHADIGYGGPDHALDQTRRLLEKDLTECGSWLLAVAMRIPVNLTIVYPQWRGLREWEGEFKNPSTDKRLRQFKSWRTVVYNEDELRLKKPRLVNRVFVARSGAWTPPWLDDKYIDLVMRSGLKHISRDIEATKDNWRNAMKMREFDYKKLKAEGVTMAEAMKKLRKAK
jgi:hypothetical protein